MNEMYKKLHNPSQMMFSIKVRYGVHEEIFNINDGQKGHEHGKLRKVSVLGVLVNPFKPKILK